MPVHNAFIGQVFDELADVLEIEGANPFRVRAYRNAARVVGSWPQSLAELASEPGGLPKIPGLGPDLRGKVEEIASTGKLALLEKERKKVPRGLVALLKIPGLGPKRVLLLRDRLRVRSARDLERVVRAGKLRALTGFGPKIEQGVLRALEKSARAPERIPLAEADQIVEPLLRYLEAGAGVRRAAVAGSYRRRQETVGDLDFLLICVDDEAGINRFVAYEEVERVLARGPTKASVLLRSGVQVDLRVVPAESFGAALHYFTGSKSHNIAVRSIGVKKGLKINEYGVYRGSKRIAGRTEKEVYASVGLPYIEPELRENRGEIEAAYEHRLPKPVTLDEIRGDLHCHTRETDGKLSLMEVAEIGQRRGYEYLAITDHSQRLTVAHGLTPKRLRKQLEEIDRLNEGFRGYRLLKSIEVDILEDGKLDLPDEILRELDLTVCSVHSKFDLPSKRQTERIIRAMDNRHFNILGHPSGRLIGTRKPYEASLERIVEAAKQRGCYLEVNAQPERMDLDDVQCRFARERGVKVSISTDSHGAHDFGTMRFGVSQARRGWLSANEVLNTRSWKELKRLLRR